MTEVRFGDNPLSVLSGVYDAVGGANALDGIEKRLYLFGRNFGEYRPSNVSIYINGRTVMTPNGWLQKEHRKVDLTYPVFLDVPLRERKE